MSNEQAIMVLGMVDAYGLADEAKKVAIKALEKQIPEDVLPYGGKWICPDCGEGLDSNNKKVGRCKCGKPLIWKGDEMSGVMKKVTECIDCKMFKPYPVDGTVGICKYYGYQTTYTDYCSRARLAEDSSAKECDGCSDPARCEDVQFCQKSPYAAPKILGKWKVVTDEDDTPLFRTKYYCSICNRWNVYGKCDFCPKCGAEMDKDD